MLSIDKINETILELERSDTTFATCDKLAACYIVRDHLVKEQEPEKTGRMAGSEFMQAASGVDVQAVLKIVDDHLEAVKILYPKEYDAIISRLYALKTD